MFTGIIEQTGTVRKRQKHGTNVDFEIEAPMATALKVDQSVAHNGVCLTVTAISGDCYWVTAIDETLKRTNLKELQVGDQVNLERCLRIGDRLDGHMVQGHVDQIAKCASIEEKEGSWVFQFEHEQLPDLTTVSKGSITVNGVSLTVVDSNVGSFSVAIIPYTYEHTNFNQLNIGHKVNLEFDILGKYIARLMARKCL